MTDRQRDLAPLARIALLVALGDFLTKEAAARWVAFDPSTFGRWLHFAVVHNQRGAFSLSLGAYTWQLNLALTLAAIAFVIPVTRDLARIDRAAPRALGLIVGGALGNLVSMILSPRGVVDFIALNFGSFELVLNVADIAAYFGLAMMMRTGFLIVSAMRRELRPQVRSFVERAGPPLVSLRRMERELDRDIYREPELVTGGQIQVPDSSVKRSDVRILHFPVIHQERVPLPSSDTLVSDLAPPSAEAR